MSWILYAFLSALFASFVAIFGKLGSQGLDSTLATAVRAIIMAIGVSILVLTRGGFSGIASFSGKAWLFITLSGISGAASWIAYFAALKYGAVSKVAPIDRLSVVITLLLAWIVLGEKMSPYVITGVILMTVGSLFILKG